MNLAALKSWIPPYLQQTRVQLTGLMTFKTLQNVIRTHPPTHRLHFPLWPSLALSLKLSFLPLGDPVRRPPSPRGLARPPDGMNSAPHQLGPVCPASPQRPVLMHLYGLPGLHRAGERPKSPQLLMASDAPST